jgi:hypothetical protein
MQREIDIEWWRQPDPPRPVGASRPAMDWDRRRIRGTVVRLTATGGTIENGGGVKYAFDKSALLAAEFESLEVGRAVLFQERNTTRKGARAISIELVRT